MTVRQLALALRAVKYRGDVREDLVEKDLPKLQVELTDEEWEEVLASACFTAPAGTGDGDEDEDEDATCTTPCTPSCTPSGPVPAATPSSTTRTASLMENRPAPLRPVPLRDYDIRRADIALENLAKTQPYQFDLNGRHNIWIVKPAGKSRCDTKRVLN